MNVSSKDYLEIIAKNIDKRMSEGFKNISDKIDEVKVVQNENCKDIQNLKTENAKNKGVFHTVSQIIQFLWLGIVTYFSVQR